MRDSDTFATENNAPSNGRRRFYVLGTVLLMAIGLGVGLGVGLSGGQNASNSATPSETTDPVSPLPTAAPTAAPTVASAPIPTTPPLSIETGIPTNAPTDEPITSSPTPAPSLGPVTVEPTAWPTTISPLSYAPITSAPVVTTSPPFTSSPVFTSIEPVTQAPVTTAPTIVVAPFQTTADPSSTDVPPTASPFNDSVRSDMPSFFNFTTTDAPTTDAPTVSPITIISAAPSADTVQNATTSSVSASPSVDSENVTTTPSTRPMSIAPITTMPNMTDSAPPSFIISAPTDAPTVVTSLPVQTVAPITADPVSSSPISLAPITTAPITSSAVTATPATPSPITLAPLTRAPVAPAPTTASPTTAPPTVSLVPSFSPSFDLLGIISAVALQGGAEFLDAGSYQSKSLAWLGGNLALQNYTDAKLVARYAMGCIYFATNGVPNALTEETGTLDPWENDDGWMTDDDECAWYGIECDAETGRIAEFSMNGNNLTGVFPPEISLVADSLVSLSLEFNEFVNADKEVAFLGDLTNLRVLDLGATYFVYDGIPTELGRLTNLEVLDISYTLMWGALRGPEVWSNLQQLSYLEIGGNAYNESIPDELAALPLLANFYAENALIEGTLDFIVKMPSIFELWMDSNPGLRGTIPTEIGLITTLESFSVTFGSLVGTLPSELGRLVGMQGMWIYGNSITGTIPKELGVMENIVEFQTESNEMSGTMPAEVCALLITGSLTQLSADCSGGSPEVDCVCCTCCQYPCP